MGLEFFAQKVRASFLHAKNPARIGVLDAHIIMMGPVYGMLGGLFPRIVFTIIRITMVANDMEKKVMEEDFTFGVLP